jgi:hypothetical protein
VFGTNCDVVFYRIGAKLDVIDYLQMEMGKEPRINPPQIGTGWNPK